MSSEDLTRILYPLTDDLGSVSLVQCAGSDKMIVNAARVSFGNDNAAPLNERDEKLIRYLLRHEHGSPFEHNLLTFKVVCPIFVDRQIVRHRTGVSKNEVSLRYTQTVERNFTPSAFRKQAPSNRQASIKDDGTLDQESATRIWERAWQMAYSAYQELLALGVTREQARGVLPLSLYTESYYTFNVRSLLHFLHLRDHEGAQYETRLYARAIASLAEPFFPVTFREWQALQAQH
jgi:thymidylate synthase (FAD)